MIWYGHLVVRFFLLLAQVWPTSEMSYFVILPLFKFLYLEYNFILLFYRYPIYYGAS